MEAIATEPGMKGSFVVRNLEIHPSPVSIHTFLGRPSVLATSVALVFGIVASIQAAGPAKKTAPKPKEPAKEDPAKKVPAGPLLDIWPIRVADIPTEGGAKHFTLRIPIKARRGAMVNPTDVTIQVRFYDLIEGDKVVPTAAKIESKWAEPPVDWLDAGMEELNVAYLLGSEDQGRKYFGYVVSVRYKDELQASTAEPKSLLEQFPP